MLVEQATELHTISGFSRQRHDKKALHRASSTNTP